MSRSGVKGVSSRRLPHAVGLSDASVKDAIEQFYTSIDTPIALSCFILYQNREFDQLVSKEIDPRQYNDVGRFRDDLTAISFLRKSEFLETSFNKRELALGGFLTAELQCRDTNKRFSNLALDPQFKGPNVWLLHAVTRKIAVILGRFRIDEVLDSGSWGPGVSLSVKGSDTSAVRKFRKENQITSSLYRLMEPLLKAAYPVWYRDGRLSEVEFREASKVLTVPKNAKIDRTIAVEPGINLWFQKGVGAVIRSRLRRNGLDLDSDTKNQALALRGSKTAGIATVDFSAASDTISYELVREIFPADWFVVLDACRSHYFTIDKQRPQHFEKFSSMGNGFTFELESLIFYAAALAVSEYLNEDQRVVSVFGDDVTLASRCYPLFCEFSKFLGFTVNTQKSFNSGYFRESCGSYWFNGQDVKPFFFKKYPSRLLSAFSLINNIRELSHRRNGNFGCDNRFRIVHTNLVESLPESLRIRGEKSAGTGCIWSNFDEARPSKNRHCIEGFFFKAYVCHALSVESDSPAVLIARLRYASTDRASNNRSELRGKVNIRIQRISVSRWYNFGPWF